MRSVTGAASLIEAFRETALRGLKCAWEVCAKDQVLTRGARACVQRTWHITLRSHTDSQRDLASVRWFLKGWREFQKVIGVVYIGFVELLVLQISLLCRRNFLGQRILRWSLLLCKWLLAEAAQCMLDCAFWWLRDIYEWVANDWTCALSWGGQSDNPNSTLGLSSAPIFSRINAGWATETGVFVKGTKVLVDDVVFHCSRNCELMDEMDSWSFFHCALGLFFPTGTTLLNHCRVGFPFLGYLSSLANDLATWCLNAWWWDFRSFSQSRFVHAQSGPTKRRPKYSEISAEVALVV